MKIAMFTDAYYPRINGVSVSVKSYAEALTELGHEVCIVCCNYQNDNNDVANNNNPTDDKIKIVRIPSLHIFFSEEDRVARLSQWHLVKTEMKAFNPDIIHINSEFLVGYYGLTYGRLKYVPIVYTFHTLWEDYVEGYIHFMPISASKKIAKDLIKIFLRSADEIITPTKRIADVVKEYHIRRHPDILPTGIPNSMSYVSEEGMAEFQDKFYNQMFPQLKGKKLLLYVGRVVKEKNLDFLFPVLKEVQKKIPEAALLIVGGGPELKPLQERSKAANLENDVFYTDYIPRETLPYYYNIAQVFTFPSVTETQGLVTVEAMMTGLPVVAIGEMGTVDVMQGDNGGFMVSNDVTEFANKVVELLQNSELYEAKCKEAKEWSSQWDLALLTHQLVSDYQKAIAHKLQKKIN